MKGLELAQRYFEEVGAPMLTEKFHKYEARIATGLVGEGSECFGFDDELSKDHDWGPSFCIWLNSEDYKEIGMAIQSEYEALPKVFDGYEKIDTKGNNYRRGVFEIKTFYKRFVGLDHPPQNLQEWRMIPEEYLAVATNGKVFSDPLGEFTYFREKLKEFYPEDIRLKKIAARCMAIAQSGQYNYPRCIKRGEYVAAYYAEAKFIDAVISMIFLLNKKYKPFYKWMHKAMLKLPVLGECIYELLIALEAVDKKETHNLYIRKSSIIEEISMHVINELYRQGLSDHKSDFLWDHGPEVQLRIQDPIIKGIDVTLD